MDLKPRVWKVWATIVVVLGSFLNGVRSWNVPSFPDDAGALPYLSLFRGWMVDQGKTYSHILDSFLRYKIFKNNMLRAVKLNVQSGGHAFFGPTQFADLTVDEFVNQVLTRSGLLSKNKKDSSPSAVRTVNSTAGTPEEWDWAKLGVVSSVKNQGPVGTCYIFSALGVLESQWARSGHDVIDLSVQQVADCHAVYESPFSSNLACGLNGGLPQSVYAYVHKTGGITAEGDYPYCLADNKTCRPCRPKGYNFLACGFYPFLTCRRRDSCKAKLDTSKFVEGIKVKEWFDFDGTEEELATLLHEVGPLSAGIDAVDLQLYKKGVLTPNKCRYSDINHAVIIVGYGQDAGKDYWKIKNSWGAQYGEKGYVRMERGGGACGILRVVTYAALE